MPGLREKNILKRRSRILSHARSLIEKGGVEALSMRKLADAVELSVRTLYNLFGSKQEILNALVAEASIDFGGAFDASSKGDALRRMQGLSNSLVDYVLANASFYRPVLLASRGIESTLEAAHDSRWADALLRALKAAEGDGLLGAFLDLRTLAGRLHQIHNASLIRWAENKINDRELRFRHRYDLQIFLLAAATDGKTRARLEREMKKILSSRGTK